MKADNEMFEFFSLIFSSCFNTELSFHFQQDKSLKYVKHYSPVCTNFSKTSLFSLCTAHFSVLAIKYNCLFIIFCAPRDI